jgi:hypothetical protein
VMNIQVEITLRKAAEDKPAWDLYPETDIV